MINFLKLILNFLTKKEVYGTIITIAACYFIYTTIVIAMNEVFNHGTNSYEKKKRKTITKLFQNIAKYIMLIIAVITLLSIYGFNVKGMIAGLGVTATIIGLALQDTFKDIISGVNIIMENYFIVGDIVTYGEFTGEVVEFGLKSTKIKNAAGDVLIVSNRNIMEIKNISSREHNMMLNIPIPYEEPVEKIEKIIEKNILPKVRKVDNVIEDSVKYLGVNELADSCINYLISFQCKRDTQWAVKREVNRIIITELNKAKVSVPYPQLEVHYEK
jgi:small conductance mechanosensitive channel